MFDNAFEFVEKLGPYTALLCLGMMGAIRWLLADRQRILAALEKVSDRETALRDKRAEELLESARLLATSSDVVKTALASAEAKIADSTRTVTEMRTALVNLDVAVRTAQGAGTWGPSTKG